MGFNKKGLLKFSFITLLLMGLIVAWLGFGERGFIHLYKMEKERQAYVEKIRLLEAENQRLLDEINRVRSDKEYLESYARRELGLLKDNEILYRFNKGAEKQSPPKTPKKQIQ